MRHIKTVKSFKSFKLSRNRVFFIVLKDLSVVRVVVTSTVNCKYFPLFLCKLNHLFFINIAGIACPLEDGVSNY